MHLATANAIIHTCVVMTDIIYQVELCYLQTYCTEDFVLRLAGDAFGTH